MAKFDSDNVDEILDKVWSQFEEDREEIVEIYRDLKATMTTAERYAVNGDTLAKYAELMTKQTAQVIELLKLVKKDSDSGGDISWDDGEIEKVSKAMEKKKK